MSGTKSKCENVESLTAISKSELRPIVNHDKARAIEVINEARSHINSAKYELTPDITGKPGAAVRFNRYKRDQIRNLDSVVRSPFFARYQADLHMNGTVELVDVLLTKARDVGGAVLGDGWLLTNWTSALGTGIRTISPGENIQIDAGRRPTYSVNLTCQYEELLPKAINARFALTGKAGAITSEDELTDENRSATVAIEPAPIEYETKPSFGLDDIIVLVDEPQKAALALPFDRSAVIEGPPGSGKTSVGLMRTAVLYDQQWELLSLDRKSDQPFHDYNTMQVVVYNEEMVEYLQSLARTIGVHQIEVTTTRDFFRRICRATRMLSGTQRRDKSSLAILKGRRESLDAYFMGFQSHASKNLYEKHR